MKKNVGTIDATIRITCGLAGLAWATAKMVRRPFSSSPMLVAVLSAMKVAEGITRYCPMLDLMNANTLSKNSVKELMKTKENKEVPEEKMGGDFHI